MSVQRGQTLGLIGRNGSGKGSLLTRFAELEAVIGEPMKTYALGMYMRLGLSVAVQEAAEAVTATQCLEEKGHRPKQAESSSRWGSRAVEIVSVKVLHPTGQERHVDRSGQPVRVALHSKMHRRVPEIVSGMAILRGERLWS